MISFWPIVNIFVRNGEKHFFEEICDGVRRDMWHFSGTKLSLINIINY